MAVLRRGGVFESELGQGVELLDLGTERVSRSGPAILRTVRAWRPDAIISTHTHLNVLVGLLAPLMPKVVALIGRESNQPSRILPTMRAGLILRIFYRAAYRNFDRIICQSEDMREDMTRSFMVKEGRVSVIHNPLSPACERNAATARESVAPFTLLAVGRLSPQKGFDLIIRAMALLPKDKYRLIVVGEGADRSELENLATELGVADAISWEGFSRDPLAYYRRADVFVLGSRYEGFPNALIEALSQGTPAAAFSCPGDVRRIVREGVDGCLAEPENPASLAEAIERVSGSRLDRTRIAADARKRYRAETIAAEYLDVIDRAMAARKGSR